MWRRVSGGVPFRRARGELASFQVEDLAGLSTYCASCHRLRSAVILAWYSLDRPKSSPCPPRGTCKRRKARRLPGFHQKREGRVVTKIGLNPSFRGPRNVLSQVSLKLGFLRLNSCPYITHTHETTPEREERRGEKRERESTKQLRCQDTVWESARW